MHTNRMEAFSDGVIAILITILVLNLTPPKGESLADLRPVLPFFLIYALSFLNLAIYWNNHHHLIQAAEKVNGAVLWANIHLLFWLSLIPFATAWVGEKPLSPGPVALYGFVVLGAGAAYNILSRMLIALNGRDSILGRAVGRDFKGLFSMAAYLAAVPLSFASIWVAYALYLAVAITWLVPDRRIEKKIETENPPEGN